MNDKKREAGCLCGAVQLELTGEPVFMGLCHCESCRRWIGSPVHGSALYESDNVSFVKGEDMLSTFKRTPDTGSIRKFCRQCGSPVLIDHPTINMTDFPVVQIPDLDFVPTAHTNYAEKVMSIRDGLPKYKDFMPMVGGSDVTLPD